jgi:putative membrane protein
MNQTQGGNGTSLNGNKKSLLSGIAAGVAGGLVASWVMNQFMAGAGPALQRVFQSEAEAQKGDQAKNDAPKEDATMKTADAIAAAIPGGRHLTWDEKQKGGPIVHYAFGALMGGLYGGLAECSPKARAGFGTAFAGLLFTGADLIAVPALNLSSSSGLETPSSLVSPFASHVVYGLTTEFVRRLVRKAL